MVHSKRNSTVRQSKPSSLVITVSPVIIRIIRVRLIPKPHFPEPWLILLPQRESQSLNGLWKVLHLLVPLLDVLGEAIKMEVPETLFQLHGKAKRVFGSLWRVNCREERVI